MMDNRLQWLLVLGSAFSAPSPAGLLIIYYCLSFETSQPRGRAPHIYTPQEQGGPAIPQALGFYLFASYGSQGYGGGIRPRLHKYSKAKSKAKSKAELFYDWPISLSWRQVTWDTRSEIFSPTEPLRISPHVTSPLTSRWGYLLWICFAFRQVYISHAQHVAEKFLLFTVHKSSLSTGFAEQIMHVLHILSCNGSFVT
jgi:hypothetical protein